MNAINEIISIEFTHEMLIGGIAVAFLLLFLCSFLIIARARTILGIFVYTAVITTILSLGYILTIYKVELESLSNANKILTMAVEDISKDANQKSIAYELKIAELEKELKLINEENQKVGELISEVLDEKNNQIDLLHTKLDKANRSFFQKAKDSFKKLKEKL